VVAAGQPGGAAVSRRALLAGLSGAVVVVLAWWFLLWSPQRSRISDARDRRRAAEEQAASLELQLRRLRDLQAREAVVRSRLERLRVAIPDQPNLAQFILAANEAAERAGIEFLSITPTPPAAPAAAARGQQAEGGGPPAEIRLSMTITGGYFQVLDFVNRLDDLPRLVVIDSINVSGGEGGQLNVSLQARMFVGVPPAEPGATTTTTATTAAAPTTTTAVTTAPPAATTTTAGAPVAPTTTAGAG
jgi:Tfp pilus assembly protein PilO